MKHQQTSHGLLNNTYLSCYFCGITIKDG